MRKRSLIFWMSFALVLIISFGYPPTVGNSQSSNARDTVAVPLQIAEAQAEINAYKDTIDTVLAEIDSIRNRK